MTNARPATPSPDLPAAGQDGTQRPPGEPFGPVEGDLLWIPDHEDGSGWAEVDWVSAAAGSRYHYRHGAPWAEADAARPAFYRVVTRLESETLRPHENSYVVSRARLADFLAEVTLAGGAEVLWHVEACPSPPGESRVGGVPDA